MNNLSPKDEAARQWYAVAEEWRVARLSAASAVDLAPLAERLNAAHDAYYGPGRSI